MEEKKLAREEAKNAEKLAMQACQEKTGIVEVYSKVTIWDYVDLLPLCYFFLYKHIMLVLETTYFLSIHGLSNSCTNSGFQV